MTNTALHAGLVSVGGGTFVVIYASCTAWAALGGRFYLGRRITTVQWVGIVVVCVGLGLSAVASSRAAAASAATTSGDAATASVSTFVAGLLLVLVGSVLHSMVFVLSDAFLVSGTNVLPWELCSYIGRIETTALLAWNAALGVYWLVVGRTRAVPDTIDGDVDVAAGSSLVVTVALFTVLWLVNAFHAFCFFELIGSIGSVSSALMKGVQSVTVYIFSAVVFCGYQQSQCFTVPKAVAVVVVLAGTLLYSLAPKHHGAPVVATDTACVSDCHASSTHVDSGGGSAAAASTAPSTSEPRELSPYSTKIVAMEAAAGASGVGTAPAPAS